LVPGKIKIKDNNNELLALPIAPDAFICTQNQDIDKY